MFQGNGLVIEGFAGNPAVCEKGLKHAIEYPWQSVYTTNLFIWPGFSVVFLHLHFGALWSVTVFRSLSLSDLYTQSYFILFA